MAFIPALVGGGAALAEGVGGLSAGLGALGAAGSIGEGAAALGGVIGNLSQIAGGASALYGGGKALFGSANAAIHGGRKKIRTAKQYIRGLGTQKGMKKFITKDLGKFLTGANKKLQSGEIAGQLQSAINTTSATANAINQATGGSFGDINDSFQNALGQIGSTGQHYHDILADYTNQADTAIGGIKNAFNSAMQPDVQNYG